MRRNLSIIVLTIAIAAASGCTAPVSDWQPASDRISTPWASEVSPDNARTEYPRPQMVRGDWKCLNGLWDYAITPVGTEQFAEPDGKILVPFCVESSLSGVGRRVSENELLWYRTTITRPSKWDGKRILLHFDAVDWAAEIYLDGTLAVSHTGGFTPFDIDVTDYLKDGSAELIVKVWDPTDNPEYSIPRGKQVSNPGGIWYTPVTGIWQSVWMEAVSAKAYIAGYDVRTDIHSGELCVEAHCVDAREDDCIEVEVLKPMIGYNPEKPRRRVIAKAASQCGRDVRLTLDSPALWSPDSPWLYGLKISLVRDGKTIDCVQGYTAFRSISEKTDDTGVKRLALNDEILFQFGPLDQGWWPDGLYTAPTAEAMAFDIEKTKELGFNMIRKHIKVEPSRWYYDCDRLGMLVWQDMPSIGYYGKDEDWGQGDDCYGAGSDYYAITDDIKHNYYEEWTDIVSHLRKFQSIVVWVPFNEAWGQFDTKAVVDYTRALDPTRLVNAASGGNWIEGAGDILDSHHYPNPCMRIVDETMVNVLGEYGGIGYPVEGHLWEEGRNWGYIQFSDTEAVTDMYLTYINDLIDIKQLDKCAAAIYTQTTDVEIEVNGFYTYDRKVLKMNAQRVREANRRVIEAPVVPELPLASPYAFHGEFPKGSRRYTSLYKLQGGGLTMQVSDFGARVISLFAPDRDGVPDDVIVGYDDIFRFLDHVLTIPASAITPVDRYLIPTGALMPVDNTPFDFREPHAIGERVGAKHLQLQYGGGYDHNWVLDVPADGGLHKVCTLSEPQSGRVMEVFSDQPGLQFYCGNFFDGSYCGKKGRTIGYREALALETQKFPDAVHHPDFPDIILRPGETYTQHTVYRFSAR